MAEQAEDLPHKLCDIMQSCSKRQFPTWKTGIIAHTLFSLPYTATAGSNYSMQKKHVNCKYCANMEELLKTGTESLCDGTDYKLFLSGVEARKDPSSWLFFDLHLKLNEHLRHC